MGCATSKGWCFQWDINPPGQKSEPVAWIAGRRETDDLKPIDWATFGVAASHRAVTKVNATDPENCSPWRPSLQPTGEGIMRTRNADRCDSSLRRGARRQHGDTETLSNWRSPPRAVWKHTEKGKPYNRYPGKGDEGERVTDGPVVAMKAGNSAGARGP